MATYMADNDDFFWPSRWSVKNEMGEDITVYFWGTDADPVDPSASPFMEYCSDKLEYLWCPSLPWGSYVPGGAVNEPTTTYGYNAWCLEPAFGGRMNSDGNRKGWQLKNRSELFVFADAALDWSTDPSSSYFLQNSSYLDPVVGMGGMPTPSPTTHFRHMGRTNALCADGHAGQFGLEGSEMNKRNLGFVGTQNVPHYDYE